MLNLTLNKDQLTDLVSNNPDLALEYFRDSSSTSGMNVTESSSFPKRLRFYMERCGVTRAAMLTFFRGNYPSLLSSESGLGHILTGIRTPKLSVVLGMAECLEIAPAKLLPGVAGTYMVKQDDHVELYMDPDPEESDESEESDKSEEVIELPEVTETEDISQENEQFDEEGWENTDEPELEPVSLEASPAAEDSIEEEDLLEVEKTEAIVEEPEQVEAIEEEEETLLEVEDDDDDDDIEDPAAEDEAKKDSEKEELEYLDDLLDNIF